MSPGSANSASSSMSMTPIWAVLTASSSCLSSWSIVFQLLLDLQGLGHGHRRAAGELVLGGQLVDLVLLAEAFDQLQQLPGERAVLVAGAIPEPFEVVELLFAHRLAGSAWPACPAASSARPGRGSLRAASLCDLAGLVGFQDLALALAEHFHERFEAGPEAADLAGIELDGAGQLLFGQTRACCRR